MAKRNFSMGEDKKANFKNFGEDRLATALDALRVLGNCGNRAQYEPSEEQVRKIELALQEAVKATVARLRTGDAADKPRVTL